MPARPPSRPPGRSARPDLATALEEALIDAVRGEPRGPLLARRLETVARALLYQYGYSSARVSARMAPEGVEVAVLLPPETPRVQQLVIRLGRASS